jgi:long-chain acyl-CoA synthetase
MAARPTVYVGTPATLQCLKDEWIERILQTFPWKRHVLSRAQKVGAELACRRIRQQAVSPLLKAKGMLFDRLVLASAREYLGGRLRTVLTTFGPTPADLLDFYEAFELRTVEGWGTCECAGLCTLNPLDLPRRGSVGRAVPGVDVVVSGGRCLRTRGPHVCLGYLGADGGTTSACDDDGWLTVHGDARMDAQGYAWLS